MSVERTAIINPTKLKFDFVDKDTDGYLDEITKEDLALLINMLESIGGPGSADGSKKAYGLNTDGTWDEEQLTKYKAENLKKRFDEQGYNFFFLRDENDKVIALASGDMNNPKWTQQIADAQRLGQEAGKEGNYFRLLNVVVVPEHRRKDAGAGGVGTELLQRINNDLVGRGVTLLEGPVSAQAQEKGLDSFYKAALEKSGYKAEEYTVTAQHNAEGALIQSVFTLQNPRLIELKKEAEVVKEVPAEEARTHETKHKKTSILEAPATKSLQPRTWQESLRRYNVDPNNVATHSRAFR